MLLDLGKIKMTRQTYEGILLTGNHPGYYNVTGITVILSSTVERRKLFLFDCFSSLDRLSVLQRHYLVGIVSLGFQGKLNTSRDSNLLGN